MSRKASSRVQPVILPPKSRRAGKAAGAVALETAQESSSRRMRLSTLPWLSARVFVTFGVVSLALIGFIAYQALTVSVVKIVVNEKQFGYTASDEDARSIVNSAIHTLGEGKDDTINVMSDDKVTYLRLRVDRKTFEENQASAEDIAQYVKTYIPGYGIRVNEDIAIVLPTQEDAEEVLEDLKERYAARSDTNNVKSVDFLEAVDIVEEKAPPLSMKTREEAKKALTEGRLRAVEHTVVEGDTLQDIAQEYNTTLDEILAENPGLTAEAGEELTNGAVLKLVEEKPYVTVIVEGERSTTEDIPFETEKKMVAQNKTVVHQEGELGAKDVKYRYISKNGVVAEEDKEYITENRKKEPVTKIIYEGTGYRAGSKIAQGSGSIPKIRWPVDSGTITSGFRTAQRPNHNGIDVGLPIGNPCYASAGGVVIVAGWGGGYGNTIVIDHGDGVGTRYAHLNKIHVAVGETVSRGQRIADTGNTGNSSGPHLHYEIFTNTDGTIRYINPAQYKP
ncbi:MAG: peptidoglycan DD-metalloendopeptidase family protein [Peptococcaceae bacterium]|nr:peptidoglycan DD-metalloendopeptidase family protein [Peptococcaceae bacterium]